MTQAVQVAPGRTLLQPGRNCWRVERAERFRCVQDGAEYFRLVREAILRATRSVFILGWDIAAGVDLLPGAEQTEAPTKLAELLDWVARRRRSLHCYVLIWDYAAFYAIERDPFSRLRLGLGTHRRVHFGFDDTHPLGASHHQKVIVVDDRLAFTGGIDLTAHRWDTSEHQVDNPLRRNALGRPYEPYHEVAAMLEGPVAASLGELARMRWRRRGRIRLPALSPAAASLWPADVEADLLDVDVAVVRTEPQLGGQPAVREAEALFRDMIAAAREAIYVENQYFTNDELAEAFAERLREADGPDLVVVGPQHCEGWLENKTMGALRERVLRQLAASDRHGRLRLLYPVASRAQDVCTFVHSKVMIVDDELLRIGSANLSKRSMAFDTECDLSVAAAGDRKVAAGIRAIRARLLAEHFGASPRVVERSLARHHTLCAAVDALAHGDRLLARLQLTADEPAESLLQDVADPQEPMAVSQAVDRLLPEIEAADRRSRFQVWMLPAATVLAGILIGWRIFGLSSWISLSGLRGLLSFGEPTLGAALATLAAFMASGLLFVPLEPLVFAAIVVLGPWRGGALALLGATGAATAGYLAGRALGGARLVPWLGERGRRVWARLAGRGAMTVAVLRALPIAPVSAIHLLCGAARVPAGEYALGTLLGLAPILLALAGLATLLRWAILHPGPLSVGATIATAVALALVARRIRTSLLARRLARTEARPRERDDLG